MILDKGIVIDAYVRVSLIGIEILTIDARIVIASVDTYLRFAEAVGPPRPRQQADESEGLPELMESMTSGGAKSKTKGALEGVKDKLTGDDDDDDDDKGTATGASAAAAPSGVLVVRLVARRAQRGRARARATARSGSPVYVYGVLAAADAASLTTTGVKGSRRSRGASRGTSPRWSATSTAARWPQRARYARTGACSRRWRARRRFCRCASAP